MTWSTPTAPETCRSATIGPAGPTRDSPSRVHDGISPENLHTTTTGLSSRGAGHEIKDTVAVAPGLAHGRARGLQAYPRPTVTILRARRPHRPPTLSLSLTPFQKAPERRRQRDAKDRRPRGLSRLPARPYTASPEGPRPPSVAAGYGLVVRVPAFNLHGDSTGAAPTFVGGRCLPHELSESL